MLHDDAGKANSTAEPCQMFHTRSIEAGTWRAGRPPECAAEDKLSAPLHEMSLSFPL